MVGISEIRRCDKCNNKSYAEPLGHVTIRSYLCKKCGITYSRLELPQTLSKVYEENPDYFSSMTLDDIIIMLENKAYLGEPIGTINKNGEIKYHREPYNLRIKKKKKE
jgi:hypothetical protein